MKTLIIAEKHSNVLKLKEMLSASFGQKWTEKGTYVESQDYIMSNFVGHLLEMAKPDEYDEKYKTWSVENLPISPERFLFNYKSNLKERGQLLVKLTKECNEIVNATDPDREGEGIFRIWYEHESIKLPVKRIWMLSLTMSDLAKAWKQIKDSKNYDNLYYSQKGRSQADWLVGMNASRLYTVLTGERCPVGRVKTATLALIVQRDYEVENYKESFTYSLTGTWDKYLFTYVDEEKSFKFDNKAILEHLINKISNDSFSVSDLINEDKKQFPPKTFSQPDLQKEASRKFGFSLNETLELTQSLYEKQLVTYPRTDSPYLPESDLANYYNLIKQMATQDQINLLLPGTKPHCVKDTQASHTAIIPTGQMPENLSENELKLYNLIKERFIVAFMRPKCYDQYTIFISNGNEQFRSIVKIVKDKGFESLYKDDDENSDDTQEFSNIDENYLKGLKEQIKNLKVNDIKKAKPKYFTPDTLITAMMNAGKNLEDKESRDIMAEVEGLGTSATRHLYPEELQKDGFIYSKGKNLISTDKGRQLIQLIAPGLKSVEKTAEMEKKLRLIESGDYNLINYRKDIDLFINDFLSQALENKETINSAFNVKRPCPKCKTGEVIRNKCSSCDFRFYPKVAGKDIDEKYIDQLFSEGKTATIKGFTGSKGKFDAKLAFDENFKVVFDFEKDILGNCSCGGEVTESLKAYNCSKCSKVVWKVVSEKKITKKTAISLMQGKKVFLEGLKNKEGKSFNANLYLDKENKIKFSF